MHALVVLGLILILWPAAWSFGMYAGWVMFIKDNKHVFSKTIFLSPWAYDRWLRDLDEDH